MKWSSCARSALPACPSPSPPRNYSTVTDLARFLGWSTSQPRRAAGGGVRGRGFEQRREQLGRRRQLEDVVGGGAGLGVAFGDDVDDDAVARLHFADVADGFFVARHRFRVG